MTAPTVYLYRAFGGDGLLLYVGITKNLEQRFREHLETHWIWEMESLTAEGFDSRLLAHEAEIAAIRAEEPRWNAMHTSDVQGAIAELRAIARTRSTPDWPRRSPEDWEALHRTVGRLIRRSYYAPRPEPSNKELS